MEIDPTSVTPENRLEQREALRPSDIILMAMERAKGSRIHPVDAIMATLGVDPPADNREREWIASRLIAEIRHINIGRQNPPETLSSSDRI